MDKIYIRDLALRCIIGIYPEERDKKQDVLINITMDTDFTRAAETDDIEATVDYKDIKQQVVSFVEKSSLNLIETMAERIAEICLKEDRVQQVTVCVDKPSALRFSRSVAVEVTRSRA